MQKRAVANSIVVGTTVLMLSVLLAYTMRSSAPSDLRFMMQSTRHAETRPLIPCRLSLIGATASREAVEVNGYLCLVPTTILNSSDKQDTNDVQQPGR